eukprot:scaffold145550_cov124-Phaeocystis_antarctica.AAC.1
MGRRLPGGTHRSAFHAQAVDMALDFGPDPVGVQSVLAVNETTTQQENKGQTQLQKDRGDRMVAAPAGRAFCAEREGRGDSCGEFQPLGPRLFVLFYP